MKPNKYWKYIRLIPGICLFALILNLSWTNLPIVLGTAKRGIPYFITQLDQEISAQLVQKYDYLDINGTMSKVLNFNSLNNIIRLKNGAVCFLPEDADNVALAQELKQVTQFLEEDDIPYLCVPFPRKASSRAVEFMPGYENDQQELEYFLSLLQKENIRHLDMDGWLVQHGWTADDIFFRTDHHWRPEAAFATAGEIMAYFKEHYTINYDPASLDLANWNVEIYEDWIIGSEGRRTGAAYSGRDDLSYIYPKTPLDHLRVDRQLPSGAPDDRTQHTVYETRYLENPTWYGDNAYLLYLGGDYAQAYIHNSQAPNDKTLLVVGDSLRLPVETFLSTQFSQVIHLDLRYYEGGTFGEFVHQTDPDLVLFLFGCPYTDETNAGIHNYNLEQWTRNFAGKSLGETILHAEEIRLEESYSTNNYHLLEANLNPGAYGLQIGSVSLSRNTEISPGAPGRFVQFDLVDLTTGTVSASRLFLADMEKPQKWLFTIPENPDANYAIVIFNGVENYTDANTTVVRDLTMAEYA